MNTKSQLELCFRGGPNANQSEPSDGRRTRTPDQAGQHAQGDIEGMTCGFGGDYPRSSHVRNIGGRTSNAADIPS